MRVDVKDIEVGHWVLCSSKWVDRQFAYPVKVEAISPTAKTLTVRTASGDWADKRRNTVEAAFTTKEEALGLFNFEQEKWKEYKATVDKTRADYLQQVKRKLEEM